jgi:hypothetical protein
MDPTGKIFDFSQNDHYSDDSKAKLDFNEEVKYGEEIKTCTLSPENKNALTISFS